MEHWVGKLSLVVLTLFILRIDAATADEQPEPANHQVAWVTDEQPLTDANANETKASGPSAVNSSPAATLHVATKTNGATAIDVTAADNSSIAGDGNDSSLIIASLDINDLETNNLVTENHSYCLDGSCDCDDCYDSSCMCGCSCDGPCDSSYEDYSWRLIKAQPLGIRFSGWANGGYTPNNHNTPTHYNGPVTFNDREDGQLNQLYATIERAVDDCGCGFDVGGRIDVLYGTDHVFTMARGLELRRDLSNRWNNGRFYGVSMPQAYMEVKHDRMRVQLGHFYRFVGYETVMAPNNFFYSRSYTSQYGEPFTHTGVLASLDATDSLTVRAGWDRGWDNWEDDNSQLSILFGGTWDNGCGTSIAANGTSGVEGSRVSGLDGDRTLYSIVLTREVSDRITTAVQHDRGIQNNAIALGQDAEWYGVTGYLYYQLNCNWTLGARSEWFRDDDGFRVQGLRTGNPIQGAQFAGDFFATSVGLNYRGPGNLIVRSEIRYDWYDGDANAGAGGTRPFDDGSQNDQLSGGVDLIIEF